MGLGMWMLYQIPSGSGRAHFGGSAFLLSKLGLPWNIPIYAGFLAVTVNLIVCVIVTLIARAAKIPEGPDSTMPSDYFADEADQRPVATPPAGH